MKTIRLLYFAQLADQRGTAEDLHAELAIDYPLAELRVAVNHAFADATSPLHDGDTVAFLVPFAGG